MFRGERGDRGRQDVAQHAAPPLEAKLLAIADVHQRARRFPFDAAASRRRIGGENGRTCAVSEQARADQHARVVVQVHRGTADLDADRQHPLGAPAREQRFGRAHVRQGGAASLADEIERQNVGRQAEPLGHVTRQARAQISGARADDHRVDVAGRETGVVERALCGARCDRRRVLRKSRVEHVGIEIEGLGQVFEREVAAADAVVAAQHFPEDRLRSRVERRKVIGRDKRVPALHLRPARRRRRGAKPAEEHSLNLAEKMRFRLRSNKWPHDRNGSIWRPKR